MLIETIQLLKEGTSKKGNKWWLFRINEKYSYFCYTAEPSFKEGDDIDCDIKTEQSGQYLNSTIIYPKKVNPNQIVMDEMAGLNQRLTKMGQYLADKFEYLKDEIQEIKDLIKPKDEL